MNSPYDQTTLIVPTQMKLTVQWRGQIVLLSVITKVQPQYSFEREILAAIISNNKDLLITEVSERFSKEIIFKFKSKTELELSREGQKLLSSTLENSCTKDL